MPNPNSSFQGQTLILPGAYYADSVNASQGGPPQATPPLVFLGFGYGVKPFTPTTFNTPQDLLNAIRGGPASGFVPFLTSPSPQLSGAQQVTFINVGQNTQSTYTASAGTSGVIKFTSADYGLPSNQLQVAIAAGTIAGKNVTLYDGYSGTSLAPGINLGVPFQLAYTGASTGVTMTVTTSGGSATVLTISSPVAGESVALSLLPSNYNTISGVVAYLNGTGFYQANVISQGDLPSSNLDAAVAVALAAPTAGVRAFVSVYATLGDIVFWCNQHASSMATAAIASGITSSSGVAPTNIPLTFFTGALSSPPAVSDYASGFTAAAAVPGWTVFADTNVSGVMALGTQHAVSMSQPAVGKFRRFFTGSSTGDTVAQAVTAAQAQNSIETCFVYPGIYRNDPVTGANTLYSGLYAAAAAAGMATGNTVPLPLTSKPLQGNGVEVALTVAQINQLQQAGVMCISKLTGVPAIVSDLTTWQTDANPANIFTQQVACRQFLGYSLIAACAPYVGTVASQLSNTNILNSAKATLNAITYSQANQNGVISSWDATSLRITYTGVNQTAALTVNVTLVGQNRFITIFVPIQPLNIVTTSSTAGSSTIPG